MATSATETVGLAVIARDEERTLPTLLDTASGCFDEVALVDTGSTDSTVAEFKAWVAAEARRQPSFKGRLGRFDWCDDFAAARNAADALLGTAWRVWADADDEIRGARHLRRLAATAPPHIAAFTATYETARTPTGEALSRSQRIRMARAGAATWRGTVHEHLVVEGELRAIAPETTLWVHGKPDERESGDRGRNLRILERWLEREPDDPRALAHAGREEAARGNHERAEAYFRRFVAGSTGWDAERAQVHRQLALSLIAQGRLAEAAQDASAVVEAMPGWPDSYLTLAEVALELGDTAAAIANARRVLELGPPDSALLHVVTDYTARPRLLIARALRGAGERVESRRLAEEALASVAGGLPPASR
jgi:tetratricopeptide (TPR) repeat protein